MANDSPPRGEAIASAAPEPGTNAGDRAAPHRLDHLFRLAARRDRLHPLQPLIRRYREEQASRGPDEEPS